MSLLVIVPTRGRPQNAVKVVRAWQETGAPDQGAQLVFAVDADDSEHNRYVHDLMAFPNTQGWLHLHTSPRWRPMVRKLDQVAALHAVGSGAPLLGFAGDDHLPRTAGWAGRYTDVLYELGTGIVYGADGYQDENLATQWAMTPDIVQALGRMVPAPVEHLYCDNSIMDLGRTLGRLRYLPDVLIEHMHPIVGKAPDDEQYGRVNSGHQRKRDRRAYREWRDSGGLLDDVSVVETMILKREQS